MPAPLFALALALSAPAAAAPPTGACPWEGVPVVEDIGARKIAVQGQKFKVGSVKQLVAFHGVLDRCGAGDTVPQFKEWRQAQAQVAAKEVQLAAVAAGAALRAATVDDAALRQQIITQASEQSALIAAEIVPLAAQAKAARVAFVLALQVTAGAQAPAAPPRAGPAGAEDAPAAGVWGAPAAMD
jgi:hypothetical protein